MKQSPLLTPAFSWKEFLLWMMGQRRRFIVSGDSMLPTLKNGDFILINPQQAIEQTYQVHDIVLCRHPQKGFEMVKRITQVTPSLLVEGDNSQNSTDSRHFGPLTTTDILGVVTALLG